MGDYGLVSPHAGRREHGGDAVSRQPIKSLTGGMPLLLALALVGCGSTPSPSPAQSDLAAASASPSITAAASPSPSPSPAATPSPTTAPAATPSPSPSASPSPDPAEFLLMPSPYTLVRDPNDTATNGTIDMSIGGKQVHATMQIAEVRRNGDAVGYVEVLGFGGMPITNAMFLNGVNGSAATTHGKVSWTKINGLKVAVVTAATLRAIEYQHGDVIVLAIASTSAGATSIATALMSVTGGTSVMPVNLAAGKHATAWFQPRLQYTTWAGWNVTDMADFLAIGDTDSEGGELFVFHNPVALSQDAACSTGPEPGVGTSAADLAAWISARPGFAVSTPKQVRIAGLKAIELEVGLAPSWTATCPFSNGYPAMPLFYRPLTDRGWWVAGSERLRLDLIDVPGKGTVVVDIDAFEVSGYRFLEARAQRIISSFAFPAK